VLNLAYGLNAAGGQPPSAPGEEAKAAFIWAKHADGSGVGGGDGSLQLFLTSALEGRNRLRIFLCDSAGPP
jgi:hypothetical protein